MVAVNYRGSSGYGYESGEKAGDQAGQAEDVAAALRYARAKAKRGVERLATRH